MRRGWLVTAIVALLANVHAARGNAQPSLDTTAVPLTTTQVSRIAPASNAKWYFERVAELAIDSRGQTFVLDDLASTIHVFDGKGNHIRSLGREGSGPGEFKRARDLQVFGDTVFVTDRGNGRSVSFSAVTGNVIANRRGAPGQFRIALSATGVIDLVPAVGTTFSEGKTRMMKLVHNDLSSNARQTISEVSLGRGYLTFPAFRGKVPSNASAKGGSLTTPQPFDNVPFYKVASDGKSVVVVERNVEGLNASVIPIGKKPSHSQIKVRRVSMNGKTIAERTIPIAVRTLLESDVKAVIDSLVHINIAPGVTFVARPKDVRDSLYVPASWPLVTEIFDGSDGTVWLRQPRRPLDRSRFWRIDTQGNALSAVEIPRALRILRVSADKLWAATEDADGSPVVEIHQINRREK